MEFVMSILAIIISIISVVVSVVIYCVGVRRDKKQATLDAINVVQEQVFDKVNQYTYAEINEICIKWKEIISEKTEKVLTLEEKEKRNYYINEYRLLSGYLARIEHFALGVNTGIYDANVAERAATLYLSQLYRGKLKPLIEVKQFGNTKLEYYAEFRKLTEKIEKIEK